MFLELATDRGQPVGIDLSRSPYAEEGLTVSISGNKGSGKSNLLGLLAEQAYEHGLPFIFYDVNGDAASLRQLGPSVKLVGDPDNPLDPARRAHYELKEAIYYPERFVDLVLKQGHSLIVDLSYNDKVDEPIVAFHRLASTHFKLSGRLRQPCMVIVDEAQRLAPQMKADDTQKECKKVMSAITADGRKRGIALVAATQRATYLDKSVIYGANVRLFGKLTWEPDFKALRSYMPPGYNHPIHGFNKFRNFKSGEFMIVSPKTWGVVRVNKKRTSDLGTTPAFRSRKNQIKSTQLTLLEA